MRQEEIQVEPRCEVRYSETFSDIEECGFWCFQKLFYKILQNSVAIKILKGKKKRLQKLKF